MSKKASLFFTVFGVTALIAIIAVFSLRIYFERKTYSAKNREQYKELENIIASSYLAKGTFSHSYFSASMRQFIKKNPEFLSIVIYSSEGPHYIFAENPDLLAFPTEDHLLNWDGAPIFIIRPFFEEVLSSEISIPTRAGTYLSAVTVILPQNSLFLFIRDTIIAAAGLLVLTIIFIAAYPFMRESTKRMPAAPSGPTAPTGKQRTFLRPFLARNRPRLAAVFRQPSKLRASAISLLRPGPGPHHFSGKGAASWKRRVYPHSKISLTAFLISGYAV